jgi:hypothetical protein
MADFSCDLVEESRKHVRFLEGLHANGVMLTPVTPRSLDRYINCWLHLVDVADNDSQLIPPPDVAWLWHCHRLAPMNYEDYVRKRFNTLLEASPSFSFQHEDDDTRDAILTRNVWYSTFPDEPFFLQDMEKGSFHNAAVIDHQCRSLEGFDLVGSTQNQATFLWQVSGPKFREDDFLIEAVENYHKFLKLSSTKEHSLPLVPTYQIDLMWHTHILWSSRGYHSDCISIRGEKFHHDDSLNDRASGATLDIAFQATKTLWEEAYNQDYSVDGGMYRGEPPPAYYDVSAWQRALTAEAIRTLDPLIAVVAGASSTRSSASNCWLEPSTYSASGYPTFMDAYPRSRQLGVNSNERKDGYIFGEGTAGSGYYAPCTRDAYKILYKRLIRQEVYAWACFDNYNVGHCLCWCTPSEAQRQERDRLEKEAKKVRAMKNYVRARYESDDPYTAISPEMIREYDSNRYRAFSDSGLGRNRVMVLYPIDDLCAAGGCGGGVIGRGDGYG